MISTDSSALNYDLANQKISANSAMTVPEISIIKISHHAYITGNVAGTSKPIILLCGWLDGQYQHLVKYLEMYASLGLPVVMLESVSADLTFYLTSFVHNDTARVLKHILPKDGVYVPHLMSNGGIRSFFCLRDNFEGELPIKAMILDSCPSVLPKNISKTNVDPRSIFFTGLKPRWFRELILSVIVNVWSLQKYWYTFFPQTNILNRQYKRLTGQFQGIPKLFLYSDNDSAIAADQVKVAINACSESSPVVSHNFVTSPHVRHLQVHREKYIQTILWFLTTYLPQYVLEEKLKSKL